MIITQQSRIESNQQEMGWDEIRYYIDAISWEFFFLVSFVVVVVVDLIFKLKSENMVETTANIDNFCLLSDYYSYI